MTTYQFMTEEDKINYICNRSTAGLVDKLASCEACLREALEDSHKWQLVVGEITNQLLREQFRYKTQTRLSTQPRTRRGEPTNLHDRQDMGY